MSAAVGAAPRGLSIVLAAAVVASWPELAAAQSSAPDLDIASALAARPPSLRMRTGPAVAAAPDQPEDDADAEPVPETDDEGAPAGEPVEPPTRLLEDLGIDEATIDDLSEKLVFRFNIGIGIDGGQPDCRSLPNTRDHRLGDETQLATECVPMATGATLDETSYYARLRAYRFGDAVLGTRGLGMPSLSTYLAAAFRFNQATGRVTTAVPSVHDSSYVEDVLVRSGYAEVDGLFENRWLAPIFVRAGRQFHYGPTVIHFDGLTTGYETRAFSVGLFSGRRVSLYGFEHSGTVETGGLVTGMNARFDMQELKDVPLVISGSVLSFDDRRYFDGGLALRWSPDVLLRASMRMNGYAPARQRLALRARISKVTTVNAELENRAAGEWMYDLLINDDEYDATDVRRYLNLGIPRPRLYANLRAGTVLLKNIDVLLRGGAAVERGDDEHNEPSSYWASYIEGGLGLEVRVRRAIALGTSFLARRYSREERVDFVDTAGIADELPSNTGAIGEKSFMEGGLTLRFRQGRHTFGAMAELYTRIYRAQSPYIPVEEEGLDTRSGGRFSVDGWANKRTRLRVEYDVAFLPEHLAPELRGVKSLRVMAEGSF